MRTTTARLRARMASRIENGVFFVLVAVAFLAFMYVENGDCVLAGACSGL